VSKEPSQTKLTSIYRGVLGIGADQYPPDYFQLLGIDRDETDVAKIEGAARQRAKALGKLFGTEDERPARIILQRLSKAKICLLDPQAHKAYEHRLAARDANTPTSHKPVQSEVLQAPKRLASPPEMPPRLPPLEQSKNDLLLDTIDLPAGIPKLRPVGRSGQQRKPHVPPRPDDSGPNHQLSRLRKQLPLISIGIVILMCSILAVILWSMPSGLTSADKETPATQPTPEEHSQPTPEEDSQPTPEEDSQPTPEEDSQPTPEEHSQPTPEEHSQPTPEEHSQPTPEEHSQPTPEEHSQPTPEEDSQPTPPVFDPNPFTVLPVAVSLPSFGPADSRIKSSAGEPFAIGTLGGTSSADLKVTLRMAAANLPANQSFQLVKSTRKNFGKAWECRTTGSVSIGSGNDSQRAIALLYFENDNVLRFRWAKGARTAHAGQLRNTVLELAAGQYRHEVRLRPVLTVRPVTLKFSDRVHVQEIQGTSLPVSRDLFLEVTRLGEFHVAAHMKPENGRADFGEQVAIRLQDWEGVEIRVRHAGTEDEPKITVASFYQVGKTWHPLTIAGLEKKRNKMRRTFEKNLLKLDSLPAAIDQVSTGLLVANSTIPSDLAQAGELVGLIGRLERKMASLEGTASRLQRSLPRTKKVMERCESLLAMISRLDGKGRIHFRFAAKTGAGMFDLLTTTMR